MAERRPETDGGAPLDATDDHDTEARRLAAVVADAADDKLGTDIVVLDVGDVLGITEHFVVISGSNDRQVRTIADEVQRRAKERLDRRPVRIEGLSELRWVLIDYGDVVVHVFLAETREFYDLERLWRDVPRVDRDDGAEGDRPAASGE